MRLLSFLARLVAYAIHEEVLETALSYGVDELDVSEAIDTLIAYGSRRVVYSRGPWHYGTAHEYSEIVV